MINISTQEIYIYSAHVSMRNSFDSLCFLVDSMFPEKLLTGSLFVFLNKAENSHLKEQLDWLRRQIFGQKSEQVFDIPGENPGLPGFEFPEEVIVEEPEKTKHVQYNRKTQNKGTCILELPKDLPVEEIIKEMPEDERIDSKTGEEFVEIGREVVDKLAHRESSYYIKRTVYIKYALKNNPLRGVKQLPAENSILAGSKFDESFMSHIVTEKLTYHTAFYRQQEKLAHIGIRMERQTFSSLFVNLGKKLEILYNEMKVATFECGYLFTDDTPVKLLEPGKGKTKEARMWIYEAARPDTPPYMIYEFTENRSHDHPIRFMKNFKGIIHADAFQAYISIHKNSDIPISWAACWAHGRRKFIEAQYGDQKFKNNILRMIKNLFRYERVAWNQNSENRLKIRNELELPIVDELFALLKTRSR